MTDTITVRRSTLSEIRSALRAFTMLCDNCHKYYCDCMLHNELSKAKFIIKTIDNLRNEKEERYYIDNPLLSIKRKVILALEQAKRPLRFGEIIMKDVYKQRKYSILRDMAKRGEIISFVKNERTFYALNKGHNNKQQQGRKPNGIRHK